MSGWRKYRHCWRCLSSSRHPSSRCPSCHRQWRAGSAGGLITEPCDLHDFDHYFWILDGYGAGKRSSPPDTMRPEGSKAPSVPGHRVIPSRCDVAPRALGAVAGGASLGWSEDGMGQRCQALCQGPHWSQGGTLVADLGKRNYHCSSVKNMPPRTRPPAGGWVKQPRLKPARGAGKEKGV